MSSPFKPTDNQTTDDTSPVASENTHSDHMHDDHMHDDHMHDDHMHGEHMDHDHMDHDHMNHDHMNSEQIDSNPLLSNPTQNDPIQSSHAAEMGILDHLRELRKRLLFIILTVAITSCFAYSIVDYIFIWICQPFKNSFPGQSLIGTGPAEAFMIKLQVSIYGGFILGLPLVAHQIWAFVEPALYEKERKTIVPIAAIATLLFVAGVLFCYYLVLPLAFSFFNSQYASIELEPNIRISDQLSTSISMMSAFGAMFEMPLIVYVLASLGLITHNSLIAVSRYAVVVIFLVSAVLTPPDVISQLLMAAPLLILYGISILVAKKAFPSENSTSTD